MELRGIRFIKVGDTVPDSAGEAQALESVTGPQTLEQLESFASSDLKAQK